VEIVVLASARADASSRVALEHACRRIPATPDFVDDDARVARLRAVAGEPETAWIVVVDADVVPHADAFGRLRRSLATAPAMLGGRGVVAGKPHYGAMFAPARCGPQPFDLAPVTGFTEEPGLADILRGPVDAPQRGMIVVAAAFVRSLPADAEIDAASLALDLAVLARVRGRTVLCEPAMSFACEPDGVTLGRRLLGLRRYARYGVWASDSLHRQPANLRSRLIDRDTRVMGNFRGYQKRPPPPIETIVYAPHDGDAVRAALARTSDRYVLLVEAGSAVPPATVETLIERIERSNRYAFALERDEPPYGAVLVNASRLAGGGTLRGDTVRSVLADAIARLPEQRLYAVGPGGVIVPPELPPLPRIGSLDVVYVAASQPMVTNQTLQALMQERAPGRTIAVFPAGAATTRRLFATYGEVELAPDAADPILAVGLNHALAVSDADAVAIVRDDVQVTHGLLERLRAAFDRVARLGVAVPRVGGADRPEGLPDLSYDSAAELQTFADRRAAAFAREATLVDVATTPVLIVSRAVLAIVGGFDEAFGFSRYGIEDFTRRVRAANFNVVCCDDAYAHLFPAGDVESLLSPLDLSPSHFARYRERWETPRGFDPARDVVPLRAAPPAVAAAEGERLRVLVPIASDAEWAAAEPALIEFAHTFRTGDPVDIVIGLDGGYALATVVTHLRDVLARASVPIEESVNIRVEPVRDLGAWRDAGAAAVRLVDCERHELAGVAAVADADAVRARLPERVRS
jgi:hypothetical protein